MATARDQMKMLQEELDRVRASIDKLRIEEDTLERMLRRMNGQSGSKRERPRSPSVKPLVLDVMKNAGTRGATSVEVDQLVRRDVPSVAKDTVSSVLSRLKADGALVYEGDRYYEKQFAPEPKPASSIGLRAVI